MANIWFISDTHFQHENILKFKDEEGALVRPGFSSAEEMDEYIIGKWNSLVKEGDKVYHLGDVGFGSNKGLAAILGRLRGKKRLCLGNHDDGRFLAPFFKKVCLWRVFKEYNFTASHIPLRLDQLRKTAFNVHGHIHERQITKPGANPYTGGLIYDSQYINVCVEHHDYTPVHLDTILSLTKS